MQGLGFSPQGGRKLQSSSPSPRATPRLRRLEKEALGVEKDCYRGLNNYQYDLGGLLYSNYSIPGPKTLLEF